MSESTTIGWPQALMTSRLLLVAMVSSLTLAAAIFLIIAPNVQGPGPIGPPILTYGFIGVAAAMIPLSQLAWGRVASFNAQRLRTSPEGFDEDRDLPPVYVQSSIVTAAILDGGAFMCLVAFLLEGETLALVVAAVLAGFILRRWPTESSVQEWKSRMIDRIREGAGRVQDVGGDSRFDEQRFGGPDFE